MMCTLQLCSAGCCYLQSKAMAAWVQEHLGDVMESQAQPDAAAPLSPKPGAEVRHGAQ